MIRSRGSHGWERPWRCRCPGDWLRPRRSDKGGRWRARRGFERRLGLFSAAHRLLKSCVCPTQLLSHGQTKNRNPTHSRQSSARSSTCPDFFKFLARAQPRRHLSQGPRPIFVCYFLLIFQHSARMVFSKRPMNLVSFAPSMSLSSSLVTAPSTSRPAADPCSIFIRGAAGPSSQALSILLNRYPRHGSKASQSPFFLSPLPSYSHLTQPPVRR